VLDAVDDLHAQVDEEDVFDEWGDRAPRETRTGLMTDTEIAERLNISDEEVRKIHNKGLPKMRRRLEIWRNE
jgi:DNA-directed RNA polymerase sigma subunit (sigma70/sigma32)